ncbi:hypothetical protein I8J29_14565 [Paenibacillus sp. MWE-103]|uniref:Uncharacterized protein n=1 Tax=Paenibacillus artemisiicola TaxID=1172618 RepID=A0ABS3WAT9_9BACL|nr:hypothetical protein [Paenibacillus artemisiicola]MBO7745432.1 hypothetical protein [Paenibacillus artemisiicola]
MHGYPVTYTEEKLRQYREDEGELRRLWIGGRKESASSRALGFAASGWWTRLMRKRPNGRRRLDTSTK